MSKIETAAYSNPQTLPGIVVFACIKLAASLPTAYLNFGLSNVPAVKMLMYCP
jgi:hypothetical protein